MLRTVSDVRNPILGVTVTLVKSLGYGLVADLPMVFLPFLIGLDVPFELQLFYLGFAFFFLGAVAGRSSIVGFLGFVGAFLGLAFAALLCWTVLPSLYALLGLTVAVPPPAWEVPLAFLLGGVGGLGGMVTGKLGLRRVQHIAENVPTLRKCDRCGSRVGLSASKCWSCRATLRS